MTAGRVSAFQSMGAVDGPGVRSVVFLQGCPLRCAYCHNPETWSAEGGIEASAGELLKKIERMRPFIKNGGVTLSGGEPLAQAAFAAELMRSLRARGFHTALDTSGCTGASSAAEDVLRSTSLVICDIKFTREDYYKKYCGGELSRTLDFLALTEALCTPLWVRQVIVPGLNDTQEDVRELACLAASFSNLEKIELLPFRRLCLPKYQKLGIDFPFEKVPECKPEFAAELQKIADAEFSRFRSSSTVAR